MSNKFYDANDYYYEKPSNKELVDSFKREFFSKPLNIKSYADNLKEVKKNKNYAEIKSKELELEINDLEKLSIIKEYIKLKDKLKALKDKVDLYNQEEIIINQEFCGHDLIYLLDYDSSDKNNIPKFKCLKCEKEIEGHIKHNQICINRGFIKANEGVYKGNISEYKNLKDIYNENKNASKEVLLYLLRDELYSNYDEYSLKLNKKE